MPVIPAFGRLKQENFQFKASKTLSQKKKEKKKINCWALVAHICYPTDSGGRAQEDHSSKPAPGNCLRNAISKTLHKKGLGEWLKV
jgi:hypothetical protein